MRYVLVSAAAAALLLAVACGGGDSVPGELKGVCTQSDSAAKDTIDVTSPASGAEVSSPLTVKGTATLDEDILYLSIVAADGTHISDYPARPGQTGTPVPFQQNVPFGVEEQTPACLWVSHSNDADPQDAIRIPITLLPGSQP